VAAVAIGVVAATNGADPAVLPADLPAAFRVVLRAVFQVVLPVVFLVGLPEARMAGPVAFAAAAATTRNVAAMEVIGADASADAEVLTPPTLFVASMKTGTA
jgi:hypothetical protein